MIWPSLWRRFIDDGFGVIKGLKSDVEYFVHQYNSLVQSIKIDKIEFGDQVHFLDLCIYKGDRFFALGKFDMKLYQKEENIYAYIPFKSVHQDHTIVNFVIEELHRYVKCNSNKLYFLKDKLSFYNRLRDRGYKKTFLNKNFRKVSYESRLELLKLYVSALGCCDQEEVHLQGKIGESLSMSKEGKMSTPDITLKIGGQFIGLQRASSLEPMITVHPNSFKMSSPYSPTLSSRMDTPSISSINSYTTSPYSPTTLTPPLQTHTNPPEPSLRLFTLPLTAFTNSQKEIQH